MLRLTRDLVGERYGRLLVVRCVGVIKETAASSRRYETWECLCDCGRTTTVRANNLKRGAVKSCGCYARELASLAGQRRARPSGQSSFNTLYIHYRHNAKRRGHAFGLSREEALELFCAPCHYCGAPPTQVMLKGQANGAFLYNGIDRRNNAHGYTLENCVSCCGRCNQAKGKGDEDDFKAWVKRVYDHMYTP